VARVGDHLRKVVDRARIRQRVERRDANRRLGLKQVLDKVGADESGASRDKN
jgi:hypothetical protein